jgi:tetratricopeptide (TPR) repeat protein
VEIDGTARNDGGRRRKVPPMPAWDTFLTPTAGLPPAASLALWNTSRDVRLWAASAPEARSRLFSGAPADLAPVWTEGALPAPVIYGIEELRMLVEGGEPGDSPLACRTIVRWAESEGLVDVAADFAEVWAMLQPAAARPAAEAGHLRMQLAEPARAEAWLRRAVGLAARQGDWEWYIRAHIRLGILRYELGDYARARPHFVKAVRRARWSGHHALAGMAYHDLLTLAIHTGTYAQGERYALRALERYPVRFRRIRHLAHDYALLLVSSSHFSAALPLLKALEPLFPPADPLRILLLSTLARAAAGVRDRGLFQSVASEVLVLVETGEHQAAPALLGVAEGRRVFEEWEEAERLAGRSLEIAARRGEGEPQRGAYRLLDSIAIRETAAPDVPPPPGSSVEEVSERFLSRLEKQHRFGILPVPVR